VTERGTPIARLVPIDRDGLEHDELGRLNPWSDLCKFPTVLTIQRN
jgi:antitoxin (DNA-binding transcriptional repressor) of toxin-antitoxin stability system